MADDRRNPPAPRQGAPTDNGIVSSRRLQEETVIVEVPGVGRVLAVVPMVPVDAPYPVREGIARRRLVALTGECPCGTRVDLNAQRQGAVDLELEHENRCPAATKTLVKAVRRWQR